MLSHLAELHAIVTEGESRDRMVTSSSMHSLKKSTKMKICTNIARSLQEKQDCQRMLRLKKNSVQLSGIREDPEGREKSLSLNKQRLLRIGNYKKSALNCVELMCCQIKRGDLMLTDTAENSVTQLPFLSCTITPKHTMNTSKSKRARKHKLSVNPGLIFLISITLRVILTTMTWMSTLVSITMMIQCLTLLNMSDTHTQRISTTAHVKDTSLRSPIMPPVK